MVQKYINSYRQLYRRPPNLDTLASSWFDLVPQMNQKLLASRVNGHPIDVGALACGYTPVELDTFAMNNSFTKKELVGRTYAGVDGYCPLAVYLGCPGYCLELALRPGKRECIWQESLDLSNVGSQANPVRRVYRLTERTIDKHCVVLLRLIGQNTLNEPDSPVHHAAKRRRIRTVMQEMMFNAARMIKHAGRWILGLGENDSGFAVFERHDGQLKTA